METRLEERGDNLGLRGPVSALMGPVLVVGPDTPARQAAQQMSRMGLTAVVVDGPELGIVTDLDLRARLVAAGKSPDVPVGELATRPVKTASPDDDVRGALEEMVSGGFQHLPVVAAGRPVGMLTGTLVLAAVGKSPFRLRRLVEKAGSVEDLAEIRHRLPDAARTLLESGMGALAVGRVLTSFADAITRRVMTLSVERIGDPPGRFAWVVLGSHGRREQALHPDQDHALVMEHDHPWFGELAEAVVDGLEKVGYPRCPHNTMAVSSFWRYDRQGWERRFDELLEETSPEHVLETSIALDGRLLVGDEDLLEVFDRLRRRAASSAPYMTRLAGVAAGFRPPLSWLGKPKVPRRGPDAGKVDIKDAVIGPIITLARLFGLVVGSAANGTTQRLEAAHRANELSAEAADILGKGYELAMKLRMLHQIEQWRRGSPLDNRIDYAGLSPWERDQLGTVFRTVNEVQESLGVRFPIAHVR